MKRAKLVVTVPPSFQHPLKVRMPGNDFAYWERLPIASNQSVEVIAVADAVLTYNCHYVSETYMPCALDWGGDCPYHADGASPRTVFQGSLPVTMREGGKVFLINPTSACLRSGFPALQDREDLCGLRMVFGRRAGGKNAKMWWMERKERKSAWFGKGFSPAEIWKTQCNIWGVELRSERSMVGMMEEMALEIDRSSGAEADANPGNSQRRQV